MNVASDCATLVFVTVVLELFVTFVDDGAMTFVERPPPVSLDEAAEAADEEICAVVDVASIGAVGLADSESEDIFGSSEALPIISPVTLG